MEQINQFQHANNKFHAGFTWSLAGSMFFETSHIAHHALLLYVLGSHTYGLLGSIFSIVYLTINIVDLGFEASLAPFLNIIAQNKATFKRIFPIYILPQTIFLTAGAFASFFFYKTLFMHPKQTLAPALVLILIISEGFRIFFRRFLHNIFLSKATVLVEQAIAILYFSTVWIPYYFFNVRLSFELVFIPYLINSLIVLAMFFAMTYKFYQTLPSNNIPLPENLWKRIFKMRYYNYLVNIEAFLISGNFLVPFFASTFGLRQAGLFKLASIFAHSTKALVKSAIHFPGNALLANIKTLALKDRIKAFYTLSHKLNHIVAFITIFLIINYNSILLFYPASPSIKVTAWYAFLFIGTTLLHQLFVVYEQFYIIEEFAGQLFIMKSIEFVLFYFLVFSNKHLTPLVTLINIALIQVFSFAILTIHAYARWKIKPYFKVGYKFITISMLFSFLVALIFRILM